LSLASKNKYPIVSCFLSERSSGPRISSYDTTRSCQGPPTFNELRINMPSVRHSLTRRNGQPQACEMCRKAKIRCNHETPQCGRCARRSLMCVYHPAPLTRPRGQARTPNTSGIPSPKESPAFDSPQRLNNLWSPAVSESQPGRESARGSTARDVGNATGSLQFSTIFSENRFSFVKNVMDDVSIA
jgi:hypothetical protein